MPLAVMPLRTEDQSLENNPGLRSAGEATGQSRANPAAIQCVGDGAGCFVPRSQCE
jgi:hypothetical protein